MVGNSYRPTALSNLNSEWRSFGLLQRVCYHLFSDFLGKMLLSSCSKSIPPCSFVALFWDNFWHNSSLIDTFASPNHFNVYLSQFSHPEEGGSIFNRNFGEKLIILDAVILQIL